MSRIDTLQARMIKTMPLPEVKGGPRLGRVRLAAAAVAQDPISTSVPGHEGQMTRALQQLYLGAENERVASKRYDGTDVDPAAWDVADSVYWRFAPADTGSGSASRFLTRWGTLLQVPRLQGEADDVYRIRILNEVFAPAITNKGLATLVDSMLGLSGTVVVEGESFFDVTDFRLNDGHMLNNGERLTPYAILGFTSFWNCFVVIIPDEFPAGVTPADLAAMVSRRRAAGCRHVATLTPTITYSNR